MILQALSLSVFFIGHSLVSPAIPEMLEICAKASKIEGRVDFAVINGAPLRVSWTDSANAQGKDGRVAVASGVYGAVVLTESVPIKEHMEYNDSKGYALRWYELAVSANPKARVYLYETWTAREAGADDGAWRKRIDRDRPDWESLVDSVNSARKPGTPEMLIVPAGQALAKLHDEIAAGHVPDLKAISELFQDDIHLTDVGKYFVTMVQYATLYGRSPEGLPRRLGAYENAPTQALATKMQQVAWEVVRGHPRSGVGG